MERLESDHEVRRELVDDRGGHANFLQAFVQRALAVE